MRSEGGAGRECRSLLKLAYVSTTYLMTSKILPHARKEPMNMEWTQKHYVEGLSPHPLSSSGRINSRATRTWDQESLQELKTSVFCRTQEFLSTRAIQVLHKNSERRCSPTNARPLDFDPRGPRMSATRQPSCNADLGKTDIRSCPGLALSTSRQKSCHKGVC